MIPPVAPPARIDFEPTVAPIVRAVEARPVRNGMQLVLHLKPAPTLARPPTFHPGMFKMTGWVEGVMAAKRSNDGITFTVTLRGAGSGSPSLALPVAGTRLLSLQADGASASLLLKPAPKPPLWKDWSTLAPEIGTRSRRVGGWAFDALPRTRSLFLAVHAAGRKATPLVPPPGPFGGIIMFVDPSDAAVVTAARAEIGPRRAVFHLELDGTPEAVEHLLRIAPGETRSRYTLAPGAFWTAQIVPGDRRVGRLTVDLPHLGGKAVPGLTLPALGRRARGVEASGEAFGLMMVPSGPVSPTEPLRPAIGTIPFETRERRGYRFAYFAGWILVVNRSLSWDWVNLSVGDPPKRRKG